MKINFEDNSQLLSHCLLQSKEVVGAVSETEEWRKDHTITATVMFNGVEMPGEVLEEVLKFFCNAIEKHYIEKYDVERLDRIIDEKARALLKTEADKALEKIYELQRKLEEVDDILVPHWERKTEDKE